MASADSWSDSSIARYKVTIGVSVGMILLLALVLVAAIWICGYSSWRSRGEIYTSIILYIYVMINILTVINMAFSDFELGI